MIEVSDIKEIKVIIKGNMVEDELEELYNISRIFMGENLYCIAIIKNRSLVRNYILTIDKDLIIDETYELNIKNLFHDIEIEYYL